MEIVSPHGRGLGALFDSGKTNLDYTLMFAVLIALSVLQKVLYRQLTSFAMPVEKDTNLEEQLHIMKAAASQKRWLLILDGDIYKYNCVAMP